MTSFFSNAFELETLLYKPEERFPVIEDAQINESPYIEIDTLSAVEEMPIYKRSSGFRINSKLKEEATLTATTETVVIEEAKTFVPFLAKITGNFPLYNGLVNQWRYSWVEMKIQNTQGYPEIVYAPGGDSGEYAINTMERGNTSGCVAPGVCVSVGCEYPVGWKAQPIGGTDGFTCVIEPVVVMYKVRLDEESRSYEYIFQAENAHDGTTCQ